MESSSCNLIVLESDMNTLSDLFLKSTDPALSSLNMDEETTDAMQLMYHQSDDLLPFVDVNNSETYTEPLETIPNVRSIVVDGNICTDLIIDAKDSLSIPDSQDEILMLTIIELDNMGESTTNTKGFETDIEDKKSTDNAVICTPFEIEEYSEAATEQDQSLMQTIELDNMGDSTTSTTGSETDKVETDEKFPTDKAVTCLPNIYFKLEQFVDVKIEKYSEVAPEQDKKDEITEALLSIGITKDYFIKSSSNKKRQLWSCPLVKCNFTTVKLDTFKIHLLKHFGKRPFKCKHLSENGTPCSWAFFSRSKLQRHELVHTREKLWMCQYEGCEKVFSNKSNLKCHMLRHDKAQEHHCPLPSCGERFNTMTQYNAHVKEHTELPAAHKCEYTDCNRSFFSVSALQSHSRVHMKDPGDPTCHLCDRTFKAVCRLKAHFEEVHENKRGFNCTYEGCKWAFATNSKLKRHMKTHLNIKAFTCSADNCGKSFLRPEHLREHSNIHLEERPKFSCSYEECHLTFFSKSSLYAHLKHIHSSFILPH